MVAICRRNELSEAYGDLAARAKLGAQFPDVTFVYLSFTLSEGFGAAATMALNQPAVLGIAGVARDGAPEQQ